MKTYARQPIAFTHGDGAWMWSTDGKRYLDGLSGIAVNGLGHNHPKLVKAISEQAGKLIHTSNLYGVVEQSNLADRLCEISGMDEAFFCNSGAEANEAAIKLAKYFGHKKGIENAKIIVMERAWHGRTLATLAATDSPKAKIGFGDLPSGFVRVPYKNFAAIEQAADDNPEIQAVLLEVLQGEGGINVADTEYLQALRKLCTAKGWLLMIDEVQSGIGRTGKWFGYQHAGIQPDVITLAKGLGSGVPIGACLAWGPAAGVFTPGTHGTTFGGGPLVSAAALATIEIMEEEGLLAHAEQMGQLIRAILSRELAGIAGVKDIRGRGLMVGIELWKPCGELVAIARDKGLIINVTRDNVVRLLPPLVIKKEEAETLAMELAPLIKAFLEQSA
ncbi:MAG: aspartate aminotransferase family protein [Limnobacter sp.]|jgi:acetylornithine/N-succinyldiaminopimelate aminotransferase|nr:MULTISPECIES: aspartate aminotransferase family protein [unclassified Limnobacter]MBT85370.1 aspartate aminotransferase family protein [Sutterellaceae bacterium]MDZ4051408.1 aspartate aminotransferase family protein [Limnobacter sp.]RZO91639.1 MAG: aspartate aminotransferase family protein [Limnobacter sp.]HAV73947.1 aspartate aminotransferase family protein [Limnobacter sp.]|tara:strand:- start:265 stop:1431 length:1167 start_codon:yes stop_codon:yes gene_type:complete